MALINEGHFMIRRFTLGLIYNMSFLGFSRRYEMAHARGGVLVAVNIDEESCLQMCRTMPLCLSGKD